MQPDKSDHANIYEVTNQEEEKELLKALNEYNPIVSDEEATGILRGKGFMWNINDIG